MLEIPGGIAREPRSTIDAVLFEREPMGANIALFEYMHLDAELLCERVYRLMDSPAIAKQQDIGEIAGFKRFRIPTIEAGNLTIVVPTAR